MAEVTELKPKALIVGAGLHFVNTRNPPLKHWERYRESFRERLQVLVDISRKVILYNEILTEGQ